MTSTTKDFERPLAGARNEIGTNLERAALGRGARTQVPRSAHGEWAPAADRPDPVSLLEEQAASRVPELVPLRYTRMLVSPFTFYRGAAYLMASDLAGAPRSGLTVQLCGDAHLSNFGSYAAPDRRLVFSLNDFDETCPVPSSGTSSAWRPALPWRAGIGALTTPSAHGSTSPSVSPTDSRWGTWPA